MSKVTIPTIQDVLATGMQFGHSASRWNPKMREYIFTSKNGIHIIDVVKSVSAIESAAAALEKIASSNTVLFVGAKRQAADIVKSEAERAGAYYVVNRWPGGTFSNFKMVRKSLAKLVELEKMFEEGVAGRTKYEVVQMKNEWNRLNRLYGGIKQMDKLPGALVVVDPRYERVAVKEAVLIGIPVVALTDTNCDPDQIDYLIPGNDDAIRSIELTMKVLADAVLAGNQGKGVAHSDKDYTTLEVEIVKPVSIGDNEEVAELDTQSSVIVEEPKRLKVSAQAVAKAGIKSKGILERVKDSADQEKQKAKEKTAGKAKTKE